MELANERSICLPLAKLEEEEVTVREALRTKPRRVAFVAAVVGVLAVLVAAVGATASSGAGPSSAKNPAASNRVAFLLPENVTPRWEGFDKPTFVKALKKLMPGITIDVLNAQNKPDSQQSQAEQEITKGAKVLVVAPIDGKAFGAIAKRAIQQGVKVVAYDRLISNAKISAYISFDGVAVGKAQGKWLSGHTKQGSRITIINGATTDDNAHLFNKGYMSVLNPLFKAHKRVRVGPKNGTWTPGWDPPTAQREMEQLLTKFHNKIDAVLSANDGMAGGIIAALKAQGKAGKVPVTGQDASLEGVQNIIRGTQGMSVFKDFRKQAPAAAKIAAAILKGKKLPGINKRVNNGAGKIPSVILPVVSIDKTNLSLLVKNGFIKQYLGGLKKVCKGVPKRNICKGH
jgi:D-xylose transport system substrate-binding protein